MFPSFTGNSRRPRQVNLSGRTANPFAAHPTARPSPGSGTQNTLAVAQQERVARQQERDRLNAARTLQRTWRGHRSRKNTHQIWREQWDLAEQQRLGRPLDFREETPHDASILPHPPAYKSDTECWMQLKVLLQFINIKDRTDVIRLQYLGYSLQMTQNGPDLADSGWILPLFRLGDIVLQILSIRDSILLSSSVSADLLTLLVFLSRLIPERMRRYSTRYYKLLADLTVDTKFCVEGANSIQSTLVDAVLCLLQPSGDTTKIAYQGFATEYLATPEILMKIGRVDFLAPGVNYMILTSALLPLLRNLPGNASLSLADGEKRLWLLASIIYFRRHTHGAHDTKQTEPELIEVVSILLNSMAEEIAVRLDLAEAVSNGDGNNNLSRRPTIKPLPEFVRREILTLLDQDQIKGLLTGMTSAPKALSPNTNNTVSSTSNNARVLATYVLTLLRVFPKSGNDIRLWLFQSNPKISAIKYFWAATEQTYAFNVIKKDHQAVVDILTVFSSDVATSLSNSRRKEGSTSQEWRVILIFLELYTYVLQVMDDEEFLSGGTSPPSSGAESTIFIRQSALPLLQVQSLTVFLKNLAFSLYWNYSMILGQNSADDGNVIRNYFNPQNASKSSEPSTKADRKSKSEEFSEYVGVSLDYLKGLVTGVLRMIYERDSRRKFLPKDHWLMTGRFDMEGFIPAVVAEHEAREERRKGFGDAEDSTDPLEEELDDDEGYDTASRTPRLGRTQRIQQSEWVAKRQRQAAQKKYLQAVAPRLEILENMPFFIPFVTRVQIFRQFIHEDQVLRRNGMVDPDNWRMSVMANAMRNPNGGASGHEIISKHHANIHRESVFEDAYEQFYPLGEGLKEPIQITFVDKFDTVEAGIDGGGVTKEFLTSVTSEAFDPSNGLNLFLENDQHLLFPNPTSVEQRKMILRDAMFKEGSPDWNHHVRELLRRYEFLGRVIGKCLYEGILVDVNFVGFFLLKWALTGGATSAAKETQYRATFNDLRDLDEGLYQGLLQLKNYTGDVEDFALNFTVIDNIPLADPMDIDGPGGKNVALTRELRPGGANIAVTNQNRLAYIQLVARHRLQNQPSLQTNAFLRGLQSIVTPSWLSMFNQAELQTLVSGVSAEIDVEDLRKNTLYGGLYVIGDDNEEHPTIRLFWEVMQSIPDADRRKVLKFVTSTPRAPLLGFSHLNPQFSIRDSSSDQDRLPSTSTCVNLLKLPRYSDAQTLRDKLLYAVNSGAGFDLS